MDTLELFVLVVLACMLIVEKSYEISTSKGRSKGKAHIRQGRHKIKSYREILIKTSVPHVGYIYLIYNGKCDNKQIFVTYQNAPFEYGFKSSQLLYFSLCIILLN